MVEIIDCKDYKKKLENAIKEANYESDYNKVVLICDSINKEGQSYCRGIINDCKKLGVDCVYSLYKEEEDDPFKPCDTAAEACGTCVFAKPLKTKATQRAFEYNDYKDIDKRLSYSTTAYAVEYILKELFCGDLSGKKICILGRSERVGLPTALILLGNDATVTICHSKTGEVEKEMANADIIVSAIGKPHIINSENVRHDCILVDVGYTFDEKTNTFLGDVDRDSFEGSENCVKIVRHIGFISRLMTILKVLED